MTKTVCKYKIWIDEAWRWPWLWSVVACALTFNPNKKIEKKFLDKITDSKKLTEKKREKLFEELIELSRWDNPKVFFGVWVVDNYLIDEINIKEANKEAMRRALLELSRKIDFENLSGVFIDWNDNYKFDILPKKPIYVVEWDAKILEIWAASIIAKVFRDKLMSQYNILYPDLWIEKHKWYWTKKHQSYLTDKSKITGIHRLRYKPVKNVLEVKEKLLLHICCWPDAAVPILDLKDKYDITCFWYDPNIHPKKEYNKRLKEFKRICKIEKIKYIEWEYDTETFFENTKWLEDLKERWERCFKCYDFRLRRTAIEARRLWIKYFTTSLIISPHKDVNKIFELWDKNALKEKIDFLKVDFRKNNGFKRSVEYTKEHNIYRQNYCGCIYGETYPKSKQ